MYTTVIIEDDPMITRLNRRYIEQDSRFAVVQTFSAAHPALFWLRRNPIDLIILDVYMPQMSGTELLLQLRAHLRMTQKRLTMPCDWARWIIWSSRSRMSGSGRRLMCSAAGEKACSATASVRMCLTIRCFRRLRRHRLSRRRRVCRARRFRALRHICAPRRRHGIPAMRSHRMSVCRS